eukprot:c23224_g1_i1.p1 GENE.c23224_g1_i1~~c23224_g1_i1.p1  ORF type:complete len:299 (-),score=50.00 c23224_g1_i1:41-937(-)
MTRPKGRRTRPQPRNPRQHGVHTIISISNHPSILAATTEVSLTFTLPYAEGESLVPKELPTFFYGLKDLKLSRGSTEATFSCKTYSALTGLENLYNNKMNLPKLGHVVSGRIDQHQFSNSLELGTLFGTHFGTHLPIQAPEMQATEDRMLSSDSSSREIVDATSNVDQLRVTQPCGPQGGYCGVAASGDCRAILSGLESFQPGWDGDDAKPVHKEVILLLDLILQQEPALTNNLIVVPLDDGRVELEWRDNNNIFRLGLAGLLVFASEADSEVHDFDEIEDVVKQATFVADVLKKRVL